MTLTQTSKIGRQGAARAHALGLGADRGREGGDGIEVIFDHVALKAIGAGDLGIGVMLGRYAHPPGVGHHAACLAQGAQVGCEGRIGGGDLREVAFVAQKFGMGAIEDPWRPPPLAGMRAMAPAARLAQASSTD